MRGYLESLVSNHCLAALAMFLLVTFTLSAASLPKVPGLSTSEIEEISPAGYKLSKHIPWHTGDGRPLRIAVFEDSNEVEQEKPVITLLLGWDGKWVVYDKVFPHMGPTEENEYGTPNYFTDIDRVQVDSCTLVLLRTMVFGGGSGYLQYFDFYNVVDNRLVLLSGFAHGKFERYYFALYNGAIYDAELVCTKGPRRHKSYVYTCYLEVKQYHFDGARICAAAAERYCERQGPWFLCDSYRFLNIEDALKKGKIFHKTG